MIGRQIERLGHNQSIERLVVATSDEDSDTPLAEYVASLGIAVYRGSLNDVLTRFHGAALAHGATNVVRLTADCPLADWDVIDDCVALHRRTGADYTSNILERSYPDGLDVEVMTFAALETAWREASAGPEREHVTPFLYHNPDRFRLEHLVQEPNLEHVRWTVDTLEDFDFVTAVYNDLYSANPAFTTADIHRWEAGR
jgi:spore coat polysaccharide biosynthesis protein SpsF